MDNNIKNYDTNTIINYFLQELGDIKAIETQRLQVEKEKLELLKKFEREFNW